VGQGSPVRSPGEVSVADKARVTLWTPVLAWACSRLSSAPGVLAQRRAGAGDQGQGGGHVRGGHRGPLDGRVAVALVEPGRRAEEEAVDPVVVAPLDQRRPGGRPGRGLGGRRRVEVRLLDQQPSARLDGSGHPRQHRRSVLGDLVQQGPAGHQVIGARRQLAGAHVQLPHREVLCREQLQEHRVDVDRGHAPRGPTVAQSHSAMLPLPPPSSRHRQPGRPRARQGAPASRGRGSWTSGRAAGTPTSRRHRECTVASAP
jgi:hypothetical protein